MKAKLDPASDSHCPADRVVWKASTELSEASGARRARTQFGPGSDRVDIACSGLLDQRDDAPKTGLAASVIASANRCFGRRDVVTH